MIEIHPIRLRGPWECEPSDGTRRRIDMPATITAVTAGGNTLSCRRRFGCPTCLDPHEEVWLVIERPAMPGKAGLNGHMLGDFCGRQTAAEFEVKRLLQERNELVLSFACLSSGNRCAAESEEELLFAEVRLEIRG